MNNPRSIFTAPRDFTRKPTDSPPLPHAPPLLRRRSTPESRLGLKVSGGVDATPFPAHTLSRHHSFQSPSHQLSIERRPWTQQEVDNQSLSRDKTIPSPRPASATRDSPRTPAAPGKKRSLAAALAGNFKEPSSEPVHKSVRLEPRNRRTLNRFSLSSAVGRDHEPPSPLFFSHSPRPRPALPPRFSSFEAAASMLTDAKEESGMKTVHLARGMLSGSPPSTASRRSVDRASIDTMSTPGIMSPNPAVRQEDTMRVLSHVGISELLEQDERPTFIVDLKDNLNFGPGQLQVVFANSSLRTHTGMFEIISGRNEYDTISSEGLSGTTWIQFKAWLLSASNEGESLNVCLPSIKFAGILWSCATLRKRLRIVSGRYPSPPVTSNTLAQNLQGQVSSIPPLSQPETLPLSSASTLNISNAEPGDYFGDAAPVSGDSVQPLHDNSDVAASIEVPRPPPLDVLNGNKSKSSSDTSDTIEHNPPLVSECVLRSATAGNIIQSRGPEQQGGFFDWTRLSDSADLPQHIQFARSVDWASTSLGPLDNWSADLRQMSNLIMASPHPAAMYWGKDLVAIYNEAYVLLAGQKHPTLMGQPYSEAWTEIWDEVKDVFDTARVTGEATMKVGYLELQVVSR